jgi:hypothetical protein
VGGTQVVVLTTVPRVPLVLGTVADDVVTAADSVGVAVCFGKVGETGAVSGGTLIPLGVMMDITISQLKKCSIAASSGVGKGFSLILSARTGSVHALGRVPQALHDFGKTRRCKVNSTARSSDQTEASTPLIRRSFSARLSVNNFDTVS